MKLHRFYIHSIALKHEFWLHDAPLLHQWVKVLRFRAGHKVILFDGISQERMYEITELNTKEAHLQLVTDMIRKTPSKEVYLLWSVLKKDKNDWVIQKATEIGVSHFVPLLAARSEKGGINLDRAQKIIIEAVEQCGRGDIPTIREPMHVGTAIEQLKSRTTLLVAHQEENSDQAVITSSSYGVLIGPEGGWTEEELHLFNQQKLIQLNLHDFTLRAETAAVTAASKLLQ